VLETENEPWALPELSAVAFEVDWLDWPPVLSAPAPSSPPSPSPSPSVPPVSPLEPSASAPAVELASAPPELAFDPAFADAEAPSPLALAFAFAFELADPPPALADALLFDSALALAASAVISLRLTFTSGTRGVAIKANAITLAETMSPNRKLLGRCMGFSPFIVDNRYA
jgi:hypothetical protein